MRVIQWIFIDAADPGAMSISTQLQQRARIIAVQWNVRAEVTLAAADRFIAELELSTLSTRVFDSSLSTGGNGIISRCIVQAAADVAGTSVALSNGCDVIYPTAFPVQVGSLVYINGGYIAQVSAGAGLLYGYCGLHMDV